MLMMMYGADLLATWPAYCSDSGLLKTASERAHARNDAGLTIAGSILLWDRARVARFARILDAHRDNQLLHKHRGTLLDLRPLLREASKPRILELKLALVDSWSRGRLWAAALLMRQLAEETVILVAVERDLRAIRIERSDIKGGEVPRTHSQGAPFFENRPARGLHASAHIFAVPPNRIEVTRLQSVRHTLNCVFRLSRSPIPVEADQRFRHVDHVGAKRRWGVTYLADFG